MVLFLTSLKITLRLLVRSNLKVGALVNSGASLLRKTNGKSF
jgi:hypothetical protein